MRFLANRGPALAVALLVVALVADAVLSLHNIREVATSVQWVSHSNEVLARLEAVLSTLKGPSCVAVSISSRSSRTGAGPCSRRDRRC